MTFFWEKRGQIFQPGQFDWMREYAQCPTSIIIDNILRVYFCTRPSKNSDADYVSYSGFADYDLQNLSKPIGVSDSPILALGGTGEFDEFGCMVGSVIKKDDRYWLYYCGWQRMRSVPYNWAIGLAFSEDGKHFQKYKKGPILGSVPEEPYLQACPIVKIIGDQWHMWYLSGREWLTDSMTGRKESVYKIMHAVSQDGILWNRNGQPIIDSTVEYECQTSPSVFWCGDKYHMFFSYRHGLNFRNAQRGYRIGYAWSEDLKNWHREDRLAGIDVSESGWDSDMVCYPHVFNYQKKFFMLYCGNQFGRNGFGLAVS